MELAERVARAKRVYILGNGGSFANAQHMANDLICCGVKAYTVDPSTLSMLANDYGWRVALALWIEVVGETGDLLIALSGSGTSENILNACAMAEKKGMDVWREFGAKQGFDMQASEEHQIFLGHG